MSSRTRLAVLVLTSAGLLSGACAGNVPEPKAGPETIQELRLLGRHAEADSLAIESGITLYWGDFELPESYEETLDRGDDPLVPGCVCCYSDATCQSIIGRSVDECWPGGVGGDDLSENVAATECVQGVACAQRRSYKCSEVLPGSECRVRAIPCCDVETTSAYCHLEL